MAFVAIVAIAPTGCGSGGSSAPASAGTSTAPTTTTTGTGARQTAAFQKFAACMKKQGVNMATFGAGAGAGAPPTGTPPSGTPPSGATAPNGRPVQAANPKFQAAFAACRSVAPQGFGTRRPGAAPNNPQFQKFTACMKSHGVTLPTGGQQTAKPIDRNSSSYKKAAAACDKLLSGPGATTTQGG